MQSSDLVLLRRKELVGTLAWIAWVLGVLLDSASPDTGWQAPCFLAGWVLTMIWVALDDRSRRGHYSGWPVLTFLTGPLGLALYYLLRKPIQPVCSHCGTTKPDTMGPCPTCGHATVFARASNALADVYTSLSNSLVRSPVEQAKETAKHVSFALGAVAVIGLWLVNAPGLLGPMRMPVAVIWALSSAAYWVLVAWWVYLDSTWRRMDGVPWAVLTLVTNVIGLVTYLVIRYPDPRICGQCGASIPTGHKYCPFCGSEAEAMCPHCQAPVKGVWQFCPVCAARLALPESVVPEPSQPPTITITGSVLDAARGTAIAGAMVSVDSLGDALSATADELGKFDLSGLDQRPYVLVASAPGYASQALAYSPGEAKSRHLCFALHESID